MRNVISCILLSLACATTSNAQTTRFNLSNILGFENNTAAGRYPVGWGGTGGFVSDGRPSKEFARAAMS